MASAASQLSQYLVTDDLTVLLALIGATVFLLNNLYKPQPLVHPILLGRQSDVGRARNPSESAVYRNYGTGLMGRFPLRPNKDVHTLADFVKSEAETSRTLWSSKITNTHLQDRVAAVGTGLIRLAKLQPHESNVLLLLNDGLEFVISDLALAAHSILSLTLSSTNLLAPILESHPPSAIITHAFLLPQILELIYDSGEQNGQHTIIVVGDPSAEAMASVASKVKVLRFTDVEREGFKVEKIMSPVPNPSDVFTVSFFETGKGPIQGAQLTHENMTAGVAATRALLPLSHAVSPLDTLVSAHSLSTPYGRAIAYMAIFEGTSFATLKSSDLYHPEAEIPQYDGSDVNSAKRYPIPSPTILFLKPLHLNYIASRIIKEASRSRLIYPIAWRHKLAGVNEGFLTKDSLWDRLVFDGARSRVLGDTAASLRAIVLSGGLLEASKLTPSRIATSVPLVNAFTHPLVPGPVLASHPLDLQDFPVTDTDSSIAHVGPPSVNIEAKLISVDDASVENGADPVGDLLVRGPPVAKLVNVEDYVDIPSEDDKEGWIATGEKARVQTNGSFKIIS
ncbi:acetyl-CoA synthetase [Cyathus striatus]|nr:acetyl-CoA synthetase [Cyathus striatus]